MEACPYCVHCSEVITTPQAERHTLGDGMLEWNVRMTYK